MKINQLSKLLQDNNKKLTDLIRRKAPVKVGALAKSHYQQNFREGGFVNNGVTPWQITRRQINGNGANKKYGPLLSKKVHLMRSIRYEAGDARVKIINDVSYAKIHNEGGDVKVSPTVTPNMRKYAWAQFYKTAGKQYKNPPEEAMKWKRLALTKKTKLSISYRMPKRQFIGESEELNDKIRDLLTKEINNILAK